MGEASSQKSPEALLSGCGLAGVPPGLCRCPKQVVFTVHLLFPS